MRALDKAFGGGILLARILHDVIAISAADARKLLALPCRHTSHCPCCRLRAVPTDPKRTDRNLRRRLLLYCGRRDSPKWRAYQVYLGATAQLLIPEHSCLRRPFVAGYAEDRAALADIRSPDGRLPAGSAVCCASDPLRVWNKTSPGHGWPALPQSFHSHLSWVFPYRFVFAKCHSRLC